GAGLGSGFADEEYLNADADIVDRSTVFGKAELIVKVKEPLPSEYDLLREGQALFTYLHLAANSELTEVLLKKRVAGFAYETLEKDGALPLLAPMSAIAGRMAPLVGAYYLQKFHGGNGVLPTGTVGVKPANAVIIGAGVVGTNAARVCLGLETDTVVINRGTERLSRIDELFGGRVKTLVLTRHHVREAIKDADLVIGALLVPGGRTPVVITREMLGIMRKGAVIVDVSVDQGGCVETARPTTHEDPIFEVDGIIHYMVANMPGAYPRTSTVALTDATLPFVRLLAGAGIGEAIREHAVMRGSLNTYDGRITNRSLPSR
ncbi:MAG TPA: alanine dehydrogenase, partial [Dissulfurispiraceae bacterium]|nr:alanine dehydrogenase [Dissulfurispiraceae bacterium]